MDPNEIKTLNELYMKLSEALSLGTKANAEKIAALEAQINEIKAAAAAEVQKKREALAIGYTPTGDPEKDFSFVRFFDGVADGWSDRTRKFPEYDMTMAAREKAMVAGVDTAGGFLVAPEIFVDQIIPALEPRVSILAAGATMVTDLVGSPVEWPRFDNYLSGYWTAENAEPNAGASSDLATSQISLKPHGVATLVELTGRLLRQTSGRVESAVREALARGLARTIDLAVFKGTGGDTQPVGILSQSGVGTVAASSYTLTSGAGQEASHFLQDIIGKLEDGDALMGKPTWFMHPYTRRWFYKFKDSTGRALLFDQNSSQVSVTTPGKQATFYGYPFFTSTQLVGSSATADLIFANVEEVLIGQWGGLTVDVDRSIGFKRGNVWLKAAMEVDVGLQHGTSVAYATSFNNTDVTP